MKPLYSFSLIPFFVLCILTTVHAQTWSPQAGNLYSNPVSTKVGVGIDAPQSLLHLNKPVGNNDDILSLSYSALNNSSSVVNWNYLNIGANYLAFNARLRNNNWQIDDGSYRANAFRVNHGWGGLDFDFYNHPTNQQGAQAQTWSPFSAGNDWKTALRINWNGSVKIGPRSITTGLHTDYQLCVDGKIIAQEYIATLTGWADYVFQDNYKMRSLDELEDFIKKNEHLPGIPTEAEIIRDGASLSEISKLQMEKIEELSLYVIQLHAAIKELKKEVNRLNPITDEK